MLTAEAVIEELRALRRRQPVRYSAFYSSQLGGIVTDPALMILPFDDHMVHRGHGIFDTAAIADGRIPRSEAHLDRFIRSAGYSKLRLPGSREQMRTSSKTTAASGSRRIHSLLVVVGPGSLELTSAPAPSPGSSS